MNYYDSYINLIKNPNETYKSHLQEIVNCLFENSSTYYDDVAEERIPGSLEFIPIDVRINSLVDAKTGQRINDDFKKIIFRDISYSPPIGTRYRFDNNIWIVFSTDNIKTDTSSVYVRRCNDTINFQDDFGNIHMEPCYVDYSITETQIFKEYSIDIARARITVYCQLNDFTKKININKRLIFGNDAYKVRIRDRFDRRETYNRDSVCMLRLQLDYDNINEYDNLEFNIADFQKHKFNIISVNSINNIVGYKNTIDYSLIDNEQCFNEKYNIQWSSSDESIAKISENGEYEFLSVGECQFIGKLLNVEYENIEKKIDIFVLENKKNQSEIIISPSVKYIKINQEQWYSVYEFLDGEKTDSKFDIKIKSGDNSCFDFYSEDNRFFIKNIKSSVEPIIIKCINKNNNNSVDFILELGGLF